MAKKGGLGRGLGEIFDEITSSYENELPTENAMEEIPLVEISLNPYQPRKVFNEANLKELSASIKRHGLLQPIVVTRNMDEYILIAGERRLRASKLANLTHIKAVIVDVEASSFHELALIENIQRENLNPIELAQSFSALLHEHDLTHEELSQQVQKSRTQITNTLRLLSLSNDTQDALAEGKITQGHAKVLIGLDAKDQELLVNSIIGQKLSVREVEHLAKSYKSTTPEIKKEKKSISTLDTHNLEVRLMKSGFMGRLSGNKFSISFENQDDIDKFTKLLDI